MTTGALLRYEANEAHGVALLQDAEFNLAKAMLIKEGYSPAKADEAISAVRTEWSGQALLSATEIKESSLWRAEVASRVHIGIKLPTWIEEEFAELNRLTATAAKMLTPG